MRKWQKGMLALSVLALFCALAMRVGEGKEASAFIVVPCAYAEEAQTPSSSATLLYKLDFSDKNDIGKNSANNDYTKAQSIDGNTLSVVENAHKGKNALNFPGGTWKNYLSLPVNMFENRDVVTFAGWFKISDSIPSYSGEISIYESGTKAIFRTDPRAQYHYNSYLFCVGKVKDVKGDSRVKPVYDAWYHMAYVIDGVAHKFTVYENGESIYESSLENDFSPAQYNADGARFYLGQSAFESDKQDYIGQMSDFRVYAGALDEASIKTEYDIDISDYMIAEYTFDEGAETTDSVRGYNLRTYKGADSPETPDPTYEDGVMKLVGNSGVQISQSGTNGKFLGGDHNVNFLKGVNSMTVSMDIKINNNIDPGEFWKRIMEFFSNGSNYVTFMSYSNRKGTNMAIVYKYNWNEYKDTADRWVLDEKPFAPKNKQWINLTYVLDGDEIFVYEDGELKGYGLTEKPKFSALFYDLITTGSFTIGACNYEGNQFINAEFDNIRIYAAAARTQEDVRTAQNGYPAWTLTYSANNDTSDSKSVFAEKNVATATAECEFEKYGYAFDGWNTQADGSGTAYAAGDAITPTADITLYAQWNCVSNKVDFDSNGGRGVMEQRIILNDQSAVFECLFSKTGYAFAGWNTQADGNGTVYAAGDAITPVTDITLYAQWTAKNYAVTFNANGGEGEMADLDMTFDSDTPLTPNAFTRYGYTFGGWALTAQGVAEYEDGEILGGIGEGNDVTLYAVWEIGSFTITFNACDGTGGARAQVATAFTVVTIANNAFTRKGYTFEGWATSEGGNAVYADGASIDMWDDVTLYAVWEIGSFTITFDACGGTGQMSAQTVTAFTVVTVASNAFTKEDCTFEGWATSKDGSVVYADGASIDMQDNITLYAVWRSNRAETPGNKPGDDKDNTGAIVGGIVGGVAAVALVAGVAFFLIRKKRKS